MEMQSAPNSLLHLLKDVRGLPRLNSGLGCHRQQVFPAGILAVPIYAGGMLSADGTAVSQIIGRRQAPFARVT